MSFRYKVYDSHIAHFLTFTVTGWVDIFSREIYRSIALDSLRYCIDNKGLQLHAWVIMSNHIHLICSCANGFEIPGFVRDFKKYTSRQILKTIQENPGESRREWMLNIFGFVGKGNMHNKDYQFWKNDYHPVILDSSEKWRQRLNYLHQNPVRAGIVWEDKDYRYSSAIDYFGSEGLLPVVLLDW